MSITVQFSGGLELIVKHEEEKIDLTKETGVKTMADLIKYIQANFVISKAQPFIANDNVRPGILVLINDCDWELCDGLEYVLEDKDSITFVTTLHGG